MLIALFYIKLVQECLNIFSKLFCYCYLVKYFLVDLNNYVYLTDNSITNNIHTPCICMYVTLRHVGLHITMYDHNNH